MKSIIRKAMVALWVLYVLFGVICCVGGEPAAGLFLALPNILSLIFVRMTKENAPAPAPIIPEPVLAMAETPAPKKDPNFTILQYRVKGTTFKNEDGTRRQTLLRKIKFQDAPFARSVDVSLAEYEYEGEPALGVYVNDLQVGNIPKEDVPFLIDNWERIEKIADFRVTGGGRSDSGENLNYGALVSVRLRNTAPEDAEEPSTPDGTITQ